MLHESIERTDFDGGREPTGANKQEPGNRVTDDFLGFLEGHAAGTIEKVILSNFMCHSELEIVFGPKVNFIVGSNGSGKTAVMEALNVGLGGNANSRPLREYIRKGCVSASIETHLSNRGADGFEQDVYGRTIIIEREIFDEYHTLKVSTCQQELVSTKEADFFEILKHFNINVETPATFITDVSNLVGTPEQRYKFTRDTTYRNIPNLDHARNIGGATLQEKKWRLDILKKKVDELEQKLMKVPELRRKGVDVDNVKVKLNRICQKYYATLDQYQRMNNEYEDYREKCFNARHESFRKFVCMRIRMYYSMLLSHVGLNGSLRVSDERQTVDIHILPDSTGGGASLDYSLLSRGEQALCNFAFIHAHRECIQCPFQCWDNFDAGLDMMARLGLTKILIKLSKDYKQAIYFSRYSVDASIGDEMMVHCL